MMFNPSASPIILVMEQYVENLTDTISLVDLKLMPVTTMTSVVLPTYTYMTNTSIYIPIVTGTCL